MNFKKFVPELPSDENAFDIFQGRWVHPIVGSDVAGSLRTIFESDMRPTLAGRAFGLDGRLDGMQTLELGPLEGGHTFLLERAGATVTAIEGNAEAYMKCLVVKEMLGMKSCFLLGSFLPWLEQGKHYDLIFASGVLYHMPDPAQLVRLIALGTDRAFFWTHYYDEKDKHRRVGEPADVDGLGVTYYRVANVGRENPRWWGGLYDSACWLNRSDLLSMIKHCGFKNVDIMAEAPVSDSGSAHITLACSK